MMHYSPPPTPHTHKHIAGDATEESIACDPAQDRRVPQTDSGASCSGRTLNDSSFPAAAASWSQEDCYQHHFQLCILVGTL